jgi:hypothetical protein
VNRICAVRNLHLGTLTVTASNSIPPNGVPKVCFVVHFLHHFISKQMYKQPAHCVAYHRCSNCQWTLYKRDVDVNRESASEPVMDTSDVCSKICRCTHCHSLLTLDRYLNNTWAYNSSSPYCPKDSTNRWCETYRGGLYDPGESSTAKAVANVFAAGASPSDIDRTEGLHIWDNSWTLDDLGAGNITLDAFPIGMPGFDYGTQNHPQGAIGLGPNSTLLSALKDAGHISSRSYGYWWGEDGATSNAQMDGSLVLGGYDAAKTQGSNITNSILTPSLSCMSGMHMTITDIIMRFPNSTRSSIIVSNSTHDQSQIFDTY